MTDMRGQPTLTLPVREEWTGRRDYIHMRMGKMDPQALMGTSTGLQRLVRKRSKMVVCRWGPR